MENNWQEHFFSFPDISLAAVTKGKGKKVVICFHGYLQNKEQFIPILNDLVAEEWKIISIDQPLHGKTEWHNLQKTFHFDFYKELWQQIFRENEGAAFYLLGFSMGGKTVMGMYLNAPVPIEKVILVAPGGVYTHPMNLFFSYNPIGQKVFEGSLRFPPPMIGLIDGLHKVGIMHKFQHRFVRAHLVSPPARKRMLSFLKVYRKFDIRSEHLMQKDNSQTEWHLIWGTKDSVVEYWHSKIFMKQVPQTHLHTIEGAKHNLLEENTEEMKVLIMSLLK